MLLYRLVQPESNQISISLDEVDDQIIDEVKHQNKETHHQTVAETERKQKMQLKIIHVKTKNECEFE